MDYSGSGGGTNSKLSQNDKAALMSNIKQQVSVQQAQELLQEISEKCFKVCVVKPSSSLSSSEQKCLGLCLDRYFDALNIVSRAYTQRLQKELSNAR